MTDEMLAWQTEQLLQLEIARDSYTVYVEPKLVVEISGLKWILARMPAVTTRREFLGSLAGATLFAQSERLEQRFERLLKDLLILDTHIETTWNIVDEGYDMGVEHNYYETDIPRLRRGHVGVVFFGIPAQPQADPP